jgi:hAT family C-terminal dimerisation region
MAKSSTTILGQIALRLFSTPANSVPSERSFSTQNLIHNKTRRALRSDKVNKLTYIYINTRILRSMGILDEDNSIDLKNKFSGQSPHSLSNAEEVELEQDILDELDWFDSDNEDNSEEESLDDESDMMIDEDEDLYE